MTRKVLYAHTGNGRSGTDESRGPIPSALRSLPDITLVCPTMDTSRDEASRWQILHALTHDGPFVGIIGAGYGGAVVYSHIVRQALTRLPVVLLQPALVPGLDAMDTGHSECISIHAVFPQGHSGVVKHFPEEKVERVEVEDVVAWVSEWVSELGGEEEVVSGDVQAARETACDDALKAGLASVKGVRLCVCVVVVVVVVRFGGGGLLIWSNGQCVC
jgi:hypothetical protein